MNEDMQTIKDYMLSQNKRGTAFPIFIIVEDKKVYGMDSDFAQDRERMPLDDMDMALLCESCQDQYDRLGTIPDECDDCDSGTFVGFRINEKVPNMRAGFFFTVQEAEHHLSVQRHHYNETAKTYAISAYHNRELRTVMEYIVGDENMGSLQ